MRHLKHLIREYSTRPKTVDDKTVRAKLRSKTATTFKLRLPRAYAPMPEDYVPQQDKPHNILLRQMHFPYSKTQGQNITS